MSPLAVLNADSGQLRIGPLIFFNERPEPNSLNHAPPQRCGAAQAPHVSCPIVSRQMRPASLFTK